MRFAAGNSQCRRREARGSVQGSKELDQSLGFVGEYAVDPTFDESHHFRFVIGVKWMHDQAEVVRFFTKRWGRDTI